MMQQWIYDLTIVIYRIGISLAAPFNKKARAWIKGRIGWERQLKSRIKDEQRPVVWVHAASLGEFEQGRPIIEAIRERNLDCFILLTFFSPSGFEIRKDYREADHVMYLPLDTQKNADRFVRAARPSIALFIKYEFWFNHLEALNAANVSTFLVSGRFYAKQGFFQSWGKWLRNGLSVFDHFYLQNEESKTLLHSIGIENSTVTGDTRYDRVIAIKETAVEITAVKQFVEDSPVIIVGSSWPQEEMRVLQFIKSNSHEHYKLIIAPHEIDESRMTAFEKDCPFQVARLSKWTEGTEARVLIVDSIGLLSMIYQYASIVIVGGGYGNGIHNVLEPAVWNVPVLFGPRYRAFPEAVELVEAGAAIPMESQVEFNNTLQLLLHDKDKRLQMGIIAGEFCLDRKGATEVVVQKVSDLLMDKN